MKFPRFVAGIIAMMVSVAVSLTTMACAGGPHVALRAPAATAPLSERQAAYQALRPVALSMTQVTHYQNGHYAGTSLVTNHLQLQGGFLVAHPDDLLAVVNDTSATANFARNYLRSRAMSRRAWAVSYVAYGVGLAIMMASLGSDGDRFNRMLISGGAVAGVGCVAMIPAYVFGSRAASARQAAFVAFEHDLPESLGFCVDAQGNLADCGASSYGMPGMR